LIEDFYFGCDCESTTTAEIKIEGVNPPPTRAKVWTVLILFLIYRKRDFSLLQFYFENIVA
jgi:hypothetical protein